MDKYLIRLPIDKLEKGDCFSWHTSKGALAKYAFMVMNEATPFSHIAIDNFPRRFHKIPNLREFLDTTKVLRLWRSQTFNPWVDDDLYPEIVKWVQRDKQISIESCNFANSVSRLIQSTTVNPRSLLWIVPSPAFRKTLRIMPIREKEFLLDLVDEFLMPLVFLKLSLGSKEKSVINPFGDNETLNVSSYHSNTHRNYIPYVRFMANYEHETMNLFLGSLSNYSNYSGVRNLDIRSVVWRICLQTPEMTSTGEFDAVFAWKNL